MFHHLTFDLESGTDPYGVSGDTSGDGKATSAAVGRILDLLAAHNTKATFFVVGTLAAKHPQLVRGIAEADHEIACHGWKHELLYHSSANHPLPVTHYLLQDLDRARKLLQDLSCQPVSGFRAPSWSIGPQNLFLLDMLKELGFTYDSSLFPAWTWLYGSNAFSRKTRKLQNGLLEFPPSVMKLGPLRLPFSGGIYMRVLPWGVIRAGISQFRRMGEPLLFYFHTWEFGQPDQSLQCCFPYGFVRNAGLRRTPGRVNRLLSSLHFETLASGIVKSSHCS
ncbi:MAG: polysaccharide deacetylase family protein [Candidatus Wallbacteria bacterium]|nr:polysaccharide deacetylase family protein [Candidatus Wallbacteria bacterium]